MVHLIGMGKDVKQMMSELKPSAGKDVRAKQRVKATSEEEQPANGKANYFGKIKKKQKKTCNILT